MKASNVRVAPGVPSQRRRVGPTKREESVISSAIKPATWTYAEEFVVEDEILTHARDRSNEVGVALDAFAKAGLYTAGHDADHGGQDNDA